MFAWRQEKIVVTKLVPIDGLQHSVYIYQQINFDVSSDYLWS